MSSTAAATPAELQPTMLVSQPSKAYGKTGMCLSNGRTRAHAATAGTMTPFPGRTAAWVAATGR